MGKDIELRRTPCDNCGKACNPNTALMDRRWPDNTFCSNTCVKRYAELENHVPSDPPFTCKFCGAPSNVDPSDQTPPAAYCHPEDHNV